MIEVIVEKEGQEVGRHRLPQGVSTVGRSEENEIVLDDAGVSRRHAQIRIEGPQVLIEDLGSGNGTFFGDTRIARKELMDGDEIIIEPFRLILHKIDDRASRKIGVKTSPPREQADEVVRAPDKGASGGMTGPHLRVTVGEGGPFALTTGEKTLGRSEQADFSIPDPSCSRRHVTVVASGSHYLLRDLGSANGTRVNGERIKEHRLKDGDTIRIGNSELVFKDGARRSSAADEPGLSHFDDSDDDPVRAEETLDEPVSRVRREDPKSLTGDAYDQTDGGGLPVEGDFFDDGMELDWADGDVGAPPEDAGMVERLSWNFRNKPTFRLVTLGGLLAFGLIIIISQMSGGGNRTAAGEEALDRDQKRIIDVSKQLLQDAGARAKDDPRGSIADFAKVVSIVDKEEVSKLRIARALRRTAEQNVRILRERIVLQRLQDEVDAKTMSEEKRQQKYEGYFSAAEDALNRCRQIRGPSLSQRVADCRLTIDQASKALELRSTSEATEIRTEGSRVLAELQGKIFKANETSLYDRLLALMTEAKSASRSGSASALQKAIGLYDQVIQSDPRGSTTFPSAALSQKKKLQGQLAQLASSRVREGMAAAERRDWLDARNALREAVAIDPFNSDARARYNKAQSECQKIALQLYQAAKAYVTNTNNESAQKSCMQALKYADRPSDPYYAKCMEMLNRIKRFETE